MITSRTKGQEQHHPERRRVSPHLALFPQAGGGAGGPAGADMTPGPWPGRAVPGNLADNASGPREPWTVSARGSPAAGRALATLLGAVDRGDAVQRAEVGGPAAQGQRREVRQAVTDRDLVL